MITPGTLYMYAMPFNGQSSISMPEGPYMRVLARRLVASDYPPIHERTFMEFLARRSCNGQLPSNTPKDLYGVSRANPNLKILFCSSRCQIVLKSVLLCVIMPVHLKVISKTPFNLCLCKVQNAKE
ncbi:hypothetical protein L1987_12137 [Smallanthus sonchifolius]|uniref:Uncharacterized protein n=1 Tax=Smallanthus sonchifolius TaxID=185202 RepID=A0ACB9JCX4_9ASTR|nr:hypothetical protein L1987_12137 [Smallanthus sonchifolius]